MLFNGTRYYFIISKYIFLSFLCIGCALATSAQTIFKEGILTYKVTITGQVPNATNEPTMSESQQGTMTLTIKDDYIKQHIHLDNNYNFCQIFNFGTGKNIVLQQMHNTKYAIEINRKEQLKKNAKEPIKVVKSPKSIYTKGTFHIQEYTASYPNGSKNIIYLSDTIQIKHPEVFESFDNLPTIPIEYYLTMSNGFTTHIELQKITTTPISGSEFTIPEQYRIISKKEYDKLIQ
jgi:hypothetical protein